MLIGSWWRLEWYIMHSRIISQISPTFGKIPRKFPEKFGNLVQISGIQSKFREFSQDFGNLNWIFQWILRKFQWFEHYSKTLKYYAYWILQSTEILWNSSDSHWNSQPSSEMRRKILQGKPNQDDDVKLYDTSVRYRHLHYLGQTWSTRVLTDSWIGTL